MFPSQPKMEPPPPPAPPPNPPTLASVANRPRSANPLGGLGSTIFTSPQGLTDQATPGRKALLGS